MLLSASKSYFSVLWHQNIMIKQQRSASQLSARGLFTTSKNESLNNWFVCRREVMNWNKISNINFLSPLRWYFVPGIGGGIWEQEAGHQPHMTHHQQTDSPLILFFLAKLGQVLGDMMNRVRHSDRVIFIPTPEFLTFMIVFSFLTKFNWNFKQKIWGYRSFFCP